MRYSDERELVTSLQGINSELEKVANSIDDMVSRVGDTPNQLEADIDANSQRILNLPEPLTDSEPVTKGYADGNYAGGAQFAEDAENFAILTEDLYTDFSKRYLGGFSVAPTTDLDGNPLEEGALYFDNNDNVMKSWSGTGWLTTYTPITEAFTDLVADSVQLSGGSGEQGKLTWNSTDKTLNLFQENKVLRLGQELQWHVQNTGGTITAGQAVMATGSTSGKLEGQLMNGTDPDNARLYLGIAAETIPSGAFGRVTARGLVTNVNTTSFPVESTLWVSTVSPGALTATKPTTGMKIPAAIVTTSSGTGALAVLGNEGSSVGNLHDVNLSGLATGNVLRYTGSTWSPVKQFQETVYELVGTSITPTNGTIQYKTLSANTTFTYGTWNSGESITLMINDGTAYTATFPTTSWVGGSPPVLNTTGYNIIVLWKVGTTVFGSYQGAA